MRPGAARSAVCVVALVALLSRVALAQSPPAVPARPSPPTPTWPVRFNLSVPLGSTFGSRRFDGFSWGFRGVVQAYPAPQGRGIGVGGFAEILFDADQNSQATFGAVVTRPLAGWSWGDLRAGLNVGARFLGEGSTSRTAVGAGVHLGVTVPAYLYDFSLGVRLDATIDNAGVSAMAVLVDVDLAALLAAFAAASKR